MIEEILKLGAYKRWSGHISVSILQYLDLCGEGYVFAVWRDVSACKMDFEGSLVSSGRAEIIHT